MWNLKAIYGKRTLSGQCTNYGTNTETDAIYLGYGKYPAVRTFDFIFDSINNCKGNPEAAKGENLYKRMGMALRNCGRDIVFSACNRGKDDVHSWIRESGANLFRSKGDIQDNRKSVKRIAISQIGRECYGGVYCHNDMDMLVVGMHGNSDNTFLRKGYSTDSQNIS